MDFEHVKVIWYNGAKIGPNMGVPHRGHRVGGCGPLLPQKFGHGPSLLDNGNTTPVRQRHLSESDICPNQGTRKKRHLSEIVT